MTPKQSLLIFSLGLIFLAGIILLVRAQRIREKYSLLWLGVSFLLLTTPFLIEFYHSIGELLGIINYISFLSFFAFLTLFLLSIQFTVALTVAYNQRKEIAQNVALLERRVADLEQQLALLVSTEQMKNQDLGGDPSPNTSRGF
ncbi:MAG: DUF2304 domain-containing protein [Magnetococcus sp. YQC-5]